MQKHKASRRYAQALFDLARHENSLDNVHEDVRFISRNIAQSHELISFILDPEIHKEKRLTVFDRLFANRVSPLTYKFICFMAGKDRLELLLEILDEFESLYHEHRNILKAKIISAHNMTSKQMDKILDRLQEKFQKDIQLEHTVDTDLIGGFQIQVADVIFDQSVRAQLLKLKNQILTA